MPLVDDDSTPKRSSAAPIEDEEETTSKKARTMTSHNDDAVDIISSLPDGVMDSIISCFTSLEMMTQLSIVSKTFQSATERMAKTLVKEESKAHYWELLTLKSRVDASCFEDDDDEPQWAQALYQMEHHVMETFCFDTLERAAHFFRHERLGRGSLASFGSYKHEMMFHADFGGLLQFMGGVTPQKSLFAKINRTLPVDNDSIIYKFIGQIYYRNTLMLGDRDYFSVGLVHKDYEHKNNKTMNSARRTEDALFLKIDPLDESLGKKNLLGIVVNMKTQTLTIQMPNAPPTKKFKTCSFQNKLTGPLSLAVRQEYDPSRRKMGRKRRLQYGNHDFAIRLSQDDKEWKRLFGSGNPRNEVDMAAGAWGWE